MKKTFLKKLVFVFVLSMIGAFSCNVVHADTTTGLVAHWKLDDASGTAASDSAGSFTGNFVGSPVWTTGKVGGALLFDGTSKFVKISSAPNVAAPYSTSFWFYLNDIALTQGFIAHGLAAADNMIFIANGSIQITSYSSGDVRAWCNRLFTSADINQWHHLTVIINSTTDASQWKCYLDGADIGIRDASNNGTFANPGTTDWTLGAYHNNSYWLNGAMDDVRIYSRSLSAADVSELYALGGGSGTTGGGTDGGGTNNTTPPVISAVSAGTVTSSSATIAWTTDEPADTQVEYGPTTSYGSATALNSQLSTSHSVSITGFPANTLYHYRVKSRDGAGNLSTSGDLTFTTSPSTSYTKNGSIITVATCSQTDVQAAINAASAGDTVNVPAGNCTWTSNVTVSKPLSIMGAGSGAGGTKLTAGSTLNNGFFYVTNFTSTQLLRISGFQFDCVNFTPYTNAIYIWNNISLDQLRIDHNVFRFGYEVITVSGSKGVIDHNTFFDPLKGIGFSAGSRAQADASWVSLAAGTGEALFVEDNQFTYDTNYPSTHNYSQESIATENGGKLVVRYNHWDANLYPNASTDTIIPFMSHGSAPGGCSSFGYWQLPSDCRRGQSVVEYYNNVIEGKRVDFLMIARGSANLIHDNTMTVTTFAPVVYLREEEYANSGCENVTGSWQPCRIGWPAEDQVHNTFIWNNSYVWKGTPGVPGVIVAPDDPAPNEKIKEGRDYFMHAPQATGGKEIFVCKSGVTNCNGASSSYPTDGVKYPTLGTMAFDPSRPNAYYGYTPYVYPHPLVSGTNPPPPPPPLPTTYAAGDFNKDGVVNSIDLSLMAGAWNTNNATYDLNSDGTVNTLDYSIMVRNWTQ